MLTYLSRLGLFIILTCSFNSFAKYSEAMCILYKQQMQQYSDNTSSRSYRNAARDYDKNCSNPPPVEQSQPQITAPKSTMPEPVTKQAEDSNAVPTEQPSKAVNPLDSSAEASTSQAKLNQTTPSETVSAAVPDAAIAVREVATPAAEFSDEAINEQAERLNAAPVIALPPVTAMNTDASSSDADTGSLLMPSLLLLAVLLLAGLLLLRLRAKKNSAPATVENNTNIAAPLFSTAEEQPNKSAVPNQDKLTQRIFSNEHDFKEPEVRTFDPDAPLPGQQPSAAIEKQLSNETITNATITNKTKLAADTATAFTSAAVNVDESSIDTKLFAADEDAEIVATKQPEGTELENDEDGSEQIFNSTVTVELLDDSCSQDFESTEPTAADSNDDIAKALAALNQELAAEQQEQALHNNECAEPAESQSSEQKANPFANLSLDPSWDPNSTEKPTIAPKKTVPKSAKLIAAEERAKQLKTDER